MMISKRILSVIAIASLVVAVASSTGGYFPITGVHTGSNATRRDVTELRRDNVSWSLCVQALAQMQADPETDPLSYFGISGIHGRPYSPWNNIDQTAGAPLVGYCTHSSVLFPTWHRPYIMLFEQIFCAYVQKIAKTYPQGVRQTYQNAADQLRWPYWDWASNSQVPAFISTPQVTIISPTGPTTTANPFFQYKWQRPLPDGEDQFPSNEGDSFLAQVNQTVRCPDYNGGPSNITAVNEHQAETNLQYEAYYAMIKAPNFDSFACDMIWGPSLENMHNSIHVNVGGTYGHMSYLSYSAFDPIFWLHHTNCDRLTAIYQAIFPTSYVTGYENYYGTYTIVPGQIDNISSPLTPFSTDSGGDFFTSATCQSTRDCGYSYPELQNNPDPSQIMSIVTNMYNPTPPSGSKRSVSPRSTITEWSVAVSVSKYACQGRQFFVRFFIGPVPQDPSKWGTSSSLVAKFTVMPPPMRAAGFDPHLTVYNEFSLMNCLANRGYDGQDINATAAYLKDNLQWRVQLIDGTVIPTESCKSLNVTAQQDVVTPGQDSSQFPTYEEVIAHPEITSGKSGGFSES